MGGYKLEDYDTWYEPCEKCGYDPGKGGRRICWRCGNILYRDYSDSALKQSVVLLDKTVKGEYHK